MVAPNSPDKDARDFVRNAVTSGKSRTLASSGVGSMPHMAIALFQTSTKADFLPTLAELGIADVEASNGYGVLAPAAPRPRRSSC